MAGGTANDAQNDDDLMPQVYEQLRALARHMMGGERPGQTLQTTALVHEAFLRLSKEDPSRWNDRKHFYLVAAQAMRRILIDRARRRRVRGESGPIRAIALSASIDGHQKNPDVVRLDAALKRLSHEDPRAAQLVSLRFFAGLTLDDAAETIGISRATANRDWSFARAWLRREMEEMEEQEALEKPR